VKALDERFGFRIGFGIEALMRMAVAAEKACRRSTSPFSARPTITGPPAPSPKGRRGAE